MYANYTELGNMTSSKEENQRETKIELYNIDGEETFKKLLSMYKIIIVDVWADFCMPCKKIAPIYQKLADKYSSQVNSKDILFLKDCIDDDSIDSVHQNMVQAVPTFFVYAYGKLQGEIIGPDIGLIDGMLNKVFDKSETTTMLNEREYQKQVFEKYQTSGVLKMKQNRPIEEEYVGVL
jgi:thioredoxin 1